MFGIFRHKPPQQYRVLYGPDNYRALLASPSVSRPVTLDTAKGLFVLHNALEIVKIVRRKE